MLKSPGSKDQIRSHDIEPHGSPIKVVSVGAGGNQALNRMIGANVRGVEFISVNTSVQALKASKAPTRLQLGAQLTHGHGTRGNSDLGRRAALEDSALIIEALDGAEVAFVVASLGGGTGTGAAPVIASLAKQMGALTVSVVTLPFGFEGRRRMKHADRGVDELLDNTDTLIVIPNERLLAVGEDRFFFDSFHLADDMLCHAVQGISDILAAPGGVNRERVELRTTMAGMGQSMVGTATRSGSTRAVDAAVAAMASPLLDSGAVHSARSILINFTGSSSLKLSEVNEASNTIRGIAHKDAEIVFSAVLDEGIGDEVKATLIVSELRLDRKGHADRATRNKEESEIEASRPIRLEKFIGRRSGGSPATAPIPAPIPAPTPAVFAQQQADPVEAASFIAAAPAETPSVPVQPEPIASASHDPVPELLEASHIAPPLEPTPLAAPVEQVVTAPAKHPVTAPAEQPADAPVEQPTVTAVEQVLAAPPEPVVTAAAEPDLEPVKAIEPEVLIAQSGKTEEHLPAIAAAPEPVHEETPVFQREESPSVFTEEPAAPHLATLRHAAFAAYAAVSMPEEAEAEESPSPQPAGFAAILESRLWKADDTDDDFETLEFDTDDAHSVTLESGPSPEHFNQPIEHEVEDTLAYDLVQEAPSGEYAETLESELFQATDFELPPSNEFFGSPVFRTAIPFKSRVPSGLGKGRFDPSLKASTPEPQMFDFSIGSTQPEDDDRLWETASQSSRTHANFPSFASGQPPAGSEEEFDELDIPAFLRRAN